MLGYEKLGDRFSVVTTAMPDIKPLHTILATARITRTRF